MLNFDDIPDDDVAATERAIARIEAKLRSASGGNRRFYEIALRGWYRHLSYAKEEAERHKTK